MKFLSRVYPLLAAVLVGLKRGPKPAILHTRKCGRAGGSGRTRTYDVFPRKINSLVP